MERVLSERGRLLRFILEVHAGGSASTGPGATRRLIDKRHYDGRIIDTGKVEEFARVWDPEGEPGAVRALVRDVVQSATGEDGNPLFQWWYGKRERQLRWHLLPLTGGRPNVAESDGDPAQVPPPVVLQPNAPAYNPVVPGGQPQWAGRGSPERRNAFEHSMHRMGDPPGPPPPGSTGMWSEGWEVRDAQGGPPGRFFRPRGEVFPHAAATQPSRPTIRAPPHNIVRATDGGHKSPPPEVRRPDSAPEVPLPAEAERPLQGPEAPPAQDLLPGDESKGDTLGETEQLQQEVREVPGEQPARQQGADAAAEEGEGVVPEDDQQEDSQPVGDHGPSPGGCLPEQKEPPMPEADGHSPPTQPSGAEEVPVPEEVGDEDLEYVSVEFDGMD